MQCGFPAHSNACLVYHSEMEGIIAGRTASEMPGLDIAEQRSWQNFLDSALRMYATLNRSLVDAHHLTLNDVRLLDILDKSATGCARMGDLADGLMSLPSRVTRQIRRLELQGLVRRGASPDDGRGVLASITEDGRSARGSGDADVRRRRTRALPGQAVPPAGRRDGRKLPADQRRTEGGGGAGEAWPRLAGLLFAPALIGPVLLSAVAWQSGLMHSP